MKKKFMVMAMISMFMFIAVSCGKEKSNVDSNTNIKNHQDEENVQSNDEKVNDKLELKNPQVGDTSTVWDCIWFGNYFQSKVKIDDPVYQELENATEWDENNEIILDGKRYKRLEKGYAEEIFFDGKNWQREKWDHATRYYRYEPIKWRVLKVEDNKALLLSDRLLDKGAYNNASKEDALSWENCTIRSWLNGLDATANLTELDCTGNNFIDTAFSEEEQKCILETENVNEGNIIFDETEDANNTMDKIFLLSLSEVCQDEATQYGFAANGIEMEDANRKAYGTEYAFAVGLDVALKGKTVTGRADWLLRTRSGIVESLGNIESEYVDWPEGIRPALVLDLTNTSVYSYAGTNKEEKPYN